MENVKWYLNGQTKIRHQNNNNNKRTEREVKE